MNEKIKKNIRNGESYAHLTALSSSSTSAPSFSYSINRQSASSTILDKFLKREATLRIPLPVVVKVLEERMSYELNKAWSLWRLFLLGSGGFSQFILGGSEASLEPRNFSSGFGWVFQVDWSWLWWGTMSGRHDLRWVYDVEILKG